jgi:uncharacterized protein YlbG (UPF0298 family)
MINVENSRIFSRGRYTRGTNKQMTKVYFGNRIGSCVNKYIPYSILDNNEIIKGSLEDKVINNIHYQFYNILYTEHKIEEILQYYPFTRNENGNIVTKVRNLPNGVIRINDYFLHLMRVSSYYTRLLEFPNIQIHKHTIMEIDENTKNFEVLLSLGVESKYVEEYSNGGNILYLSEELDERRFILFINNKFLEDKYKKLWKFVYTKYIPLFVQENIDVVYTNNIKDRMFNTINIIPRFSTLSERKTYLENLNKYTSKEPALITPTEDTITISRNYSNTPALSGIGPIEEEIQHEVEDERIVLWRDGRRIGDDISQEETEEDIIDLENDGIIESEERVEDEELTEEGNDILNMARNISEEQIQQLFDQANLEHGQQHTVNPEDSYSDLPF